MSDVDDKTPNRDFALPNRGNKLKDDVVRIRNALLAIDADVAALIMAVAAKAAAVHPHEIADVAGLIAALASKAASDHEHGLDDISNVNLTGAANGQFLAKQGEFWIPAFVAIASVSGLTEALASKATPADITAAFAAFVGAAPAALDTVYELAAAIGSDPNFATTVANQIGTKSAKSANLSDLANVLTARTNLKIVPIAQAAYDALTKDPDTLYFIY